MGTNQGQIYCKHCGKLIDADSTFCMHCGRTIRNGNSATLIDGQREESFIRLIDSLGAKALMVVINFVKWIVNLIKRFFVNIFKFLGKIIELLGGFIKRNWKRILIFIIGIGVATALIVFFRFEHNLAIPVVPAMILILVTLYFSCSKSVKFLLPSIALLLSSYGVWIYIEYNEIYGPNTTFFDTVKREFYWVTRNFTIPNHAILIGSNNMGVGAFAGCSSLTSITIPESVTVIVDNAFEGCSSLTSITISESVTVIGDDAFKGCSSLTSITIPESVTVIGESAFADCSSLTSITIPESVTAIGRFAFEGCSSLTSITIPESVTVIEDDAFYNCSSLTSITIPESVTVIQGCAFYNCSSLTSITIPESVTAIGWLVFEGCSSLTSITIPESVTEIGGCAFRGCSSLTSVYCKAITPPKARFHEQWQVFDNNAHDRKIYVPRKSVNAYKTAEGWSEYADCIVGYDF